MHNPSPHLLLKKQTLLPLLGGLPLLEQIPRPSVRQVVLLTRQHLCGKAAGCWQPAWASSKGHKVLSYPQLHVLENISATSVWPGEKQGVQSAKGRTGLFPKGKRVNWENIHGIGLIELGQRARASEKFQYWMDNKSYLLDIKKVVVWIWNYSILTFSLKSPTHPMVISWVFHNFHSELRPVRLSVRPNSSSKYLRRNIS